MLQKEDKDIHKKYLNYSRNLLEYFDYIEDTINNKLNKIYNNEYILIDKIKKEHPFMQKNIVFYILSIIYNNKSNIIHEKNILDIIKVINNDKPNIKINLPKNYVAIKEYNKIYIKKKKDDNVNYNYMFKDMIEIDDIIIKKIDKIDSDGNDVCRLNSNIITNDNML